ncbi:MAG: hypothetical protein UV57_C0023G0012 [Parcubacteria group bacterium GW2011_GWD2_43_10]|nr:MAG: hypothetical protein UV57_C0023G0012 [Parcubacteria group bacterium GW2011_GWD2_43_10]
MANVIWVLVNCNSLKEAKSIGRACLKARLASCFDIFKRELTQYFWPPRSGKTESARGALLIAQLPRLRRLVKKLHTDKLPFIGSLKIEVEPAFASWVKAELK